MSDALSLGDAGGSTICTWPSPRQSDLPGVLGLVVTASSSWTPAGFLMDSGFIFPAGVPVEPLPSSPGGGDQGIS